LPAGTHERAGILARRGEVEPFLACARRHADALPELGKRADRAENLGVERLAEIGMDRVAIPDAAGDVELLDDVARCQLLRQLSRVAEERLLVAGRTGDDVAAAHARRAAARQPDLVGDRPLVEHPHGDDDPPVRRGISGTTISFRRRTVPRRSNATSAFCRSSRMSVSPGMVTPV
jgi:hypothetical protein